MSQLKITRSEREKLSDIDEKEFPKYTTQILNIAVNNAQANRPHTVGSMNAFEEEFQESGGGFEEWKEFYQEKKDGEERIDEAIEKTVEMLEKMRDAMAEIDREMIRDYVEDLVLNQTYVGFNIQRVILKKVASEHGLDYSFSGPGDESKGIDGYIGEQPVSIKPETYRRKNLQEEIDVPIIYYRENDNKTLVVDTSELDKELEA
ncbi:MAG: MjaI family restriction endonuclease [Candidatus Nanohaloarchaea archaeon]